jgi:hypothetical protein
MSRYETVQTGQPTRYRSGLRSSKEYKVIVELSTPRDDLEIRLEKKINDATAYDWEVSAIFQGAVGIVVLMERKERTDLK